MARSCTGSIEAHHRIAQHWAEDGRLKIDYDSPGCFACGYCKDCTSEDVEYAWAHVGLEKCHIVGRSEDGARTPENLVLLCPRCHIAAPMTMLPEVMIRWIVDQEDFMTRVMREAIESTWKAGVTPEELKKLNRDRFLRFLEGIRFDRHPKGYASFVDMRSIGPIVRVYLDCME